MIYVFLIITNASRLQHPLQPLRDNLESQTYETFEYDTTKYVLYEKAVYKALMDKPVDSTTVVMVCGAGRGPLVDRCINASQISGRKIKLYAIEKNLNAVTFMKSKNWKDVTLVHTDMRTFNPPEKVTLYISIEN